MIGALSGYGQPMGALSNGLGSLSGRPPGMMGGGMMTRPPQLMQPPWQGQDLRYGGMGGPTFPKPPWQGGAGMGPVGNGAFGHAVDQFGNPFGAGWGKPGMSPTMPPPMMANPGTPPPGAFGPLPPSFGPASSVPAGGMQMPPWLQSWMMARGNQAPQAQAPAAPREMMAGGNLAPGLQGPGAQFRRPPEMMTWSR